MRNGSVRAITHHVVMAGLVPAIHVYVAALLLRRGCPRPAAPERSEASKCGHDGVMFKAVYANRKQVDRPQCADTSQPPSCMHSSEVEIFLVLPRGDVRGVVGLTARLGIAARDLGLLDAQVIVDEGVAEAGAEAGAGLERGQRLGERLRQRLGRRPRRACRPTGRDRACARCRRGRRESATPCRGRDWPAARRRGSPDASPDRRARRARAS